MPMILDLGYLAVEQTFRAPHPWQKALLQAAIAVELPDRAAYCSQLQSYQTKIIDPRGTFEISILSGHVSRNRSGIPIISGKFLEEKLGISSLAMEVIVFVGRDGFLSEVEMLLAVDNKQLPLRVDIERLMFTAENTEVPPTDIA